HEGEALAAVLLGPGGADPAALVELLGPGLVELRLLLGRHLEALVEPSVGQVLLEPAPDLGAELLGFGRVGQVHGPNVGAIASPGRTREWPPARDACLESQTWP